jgi:hypothetical protein
MSWKVEKLGRFVPAGAGDDDDRIGLERSLLDVKQERVAQQPSLLRLALFGLHKAHHFQAFQVGRTKGAHEQSIQVDGDAALERAVVEVGNETGEAAGQGTLATT